MASILSQWANMYYKKFESKTPIETKIYKDFFTNEEVHEILDCINKQKQLEVGTDFYAPTLQPSLGRVHIEVKYPKYILKKLEDFASKLCGEKVVLTHNSYYHYNKKYNPEIETPVLRPHRDLDNYYSKLTLDYQLEKNIDWDILIENKRYSLEVGDMLAFWGAGLIHWRENIVLDENESTAVLTLHFSNEEDYKNLNRVSRLPEEREKRKLANSEDDVFQDYNKKWEQERLNFNSKTKGV
jgi:hypothetical protein